MDFSTGTPYRVTSRHPAMTTLVDSVGRLSKLLAEETLAEEKIHASEAALAAIKKKISESLVQNYISHGTNIKMPEDLMSQEEYYERLLLGLQEMKREIAQKIRPLELQIIEANREHLRETFEQYAGKLDECLGAIDEHILASRQLLQEYENILSALKSLNDKLAQLGAIPLDFPAAPPSRDLAGLIRSRLEHLQEQGRI